MRAGAVTAAATLMMLMTSPAMALTQDDGEQAGNGLTVAQTLGLYVALPIAIFLAITGLVLIGTRKSVRKP
jgi:threonine/homoserine/homoserine lactone efflux protein